MERDLRHDDAALSLFAIIGKTPTHSDWRLFGQQRHAIVAFLTVIEHVVTESGDILEREHVVVNFCLLQANDIGLVFSTMAAS